MSLLFPARLHSAIRISTLPVHTKSLICITPLNRSQTLSYTKMTGAAKRQRTDPEYELLYHPGIPGRGEFIRLAFQATGTSYRDPANDDPPNDSGANGYGIVQKLCTNPDSLGEDGNPPVFAPPALRVSGAGKNGKDLIIHQTSNILLFLGPKLGLVGSDEQDLYHVNQLALTALDLNNEIHDTHHPVSVMSYYEGVSNLSSPSSHTQANPTARPKTRIPQESKRRPPEPHT